MILSDSSRAAATCLSLTHTHSDGPPRRSQMFNGFVATELGPVLAHENVLFGKAWLVRNYIARVDKNVGVAPGPAHGAQGVAFTGMDERVRIYRRDAGPVALAVVVFTGHCQHKPTGYFAQMSTDAHD